MQNKPELTSLSRDTSLGQYKLREVLNTDEFSITYNAWDTKRYRLLLIKEYFPNKFAIRDKNTLTVAASEGYKDEYQKGLERFLDTLQNDLRSAKRPKCILIRQRGKVGSINQILNIRILDCFG